MCGDGKWGQSFFFFNCASSFLSSLSDFFFLLTEQFMYQPKHFGNFRFKGLRDIWKKRICLGCGVCVNACTCCIHILMCTHIFSSVSIDDTACVYVCSVCLFAHGWQCACGYVSALVWACIHISPCSGPCLNVCMTLCLCTWEHV